MKKALMKVVLIVMTLVTLLTVIPLSASASTSNKTQVFSYLTKELGFNSAAACGIMANIEKESNFKSSTVIRDSNGLLSGGLCMWNGSRLTSLKNFCSKRGYNYLSVKGQMEYLEYELKNGYKKVYNYLRNVSNSSSGAYNAAYYWCYYFEVPANRASKAKQRGNSAAGTYWNAYGNKSLSKPTLSFSKDKTTYSLDSTITLKWTSAGKNADLYKVYVAEKNTKTGKYDWEHAGIYKTSSLSQKISTNYHGKGYYSVFVQAINSATGNYKNSNYLTFTIGCVEHDYKTKVTKEPTLTKTGTSTLTCKDCGYKTTKEIPKVNYKTIGDYKMTTPTSIDDLRKSDSITLKWSKYDGAEGYFVYLRQDNKWVKVGTTDKTEFTVENLPEGTQSKFAVRAYITYKDKTYATAYSKSYTAFTETAPVTLLYAISKDTGCAKLRWTKEEKATGYILYTSPDGEKWEKAVTIKDNDTVSYTFEKLDGGKPCYFKACTYIKDDSESIYSAMSNTLNITVKN